MKLLAAIAIILSANLFALNDETKEIVTVSTANLIGENEIEVNFSYAGGCEEHDFQLEVTNICTLSIPRQCLAEIVDRADVNDNCEAQISESKVFKIDPSVTEEPTILLIKTGKEDVVKVDLTAVEAPIREVAVLNQVSLAAPFIDEEGYFNLDVTARVQVGGNACQAENVDVELIWEVIDQTISVQAVRIIPAATYEKFCNLIYRPVFADVKTSIRVQESRAKELVLKNLQEMDKDYLLEIY